MTDDDGALMQLVLERGYLFRRQAVTLLIVGTDSVTLALTKDEALRTMGRSADAGRGD